MASDAENTNIEKVGDMRVDGSVKLSRVLLTCTESVLLRQNEEKSSS